MRPAYTLAALLLIAAAPARAQHPVADPTRPHIGTGWITSDLVTDSSRTRDRYATIAFGTTVPLLRIQPGQVQVSAHLETTFLSRFRVRRRAEHIDYDNTNTEWFLGVATDVQHRGTTLRLRPYHRSAHLGDDMFTYDDLSAHEATEERTEILWIQAWHPSLRTYAGLEHFWGNPDSPLADPHRRIHLAADLQAPLAQTAVLLAGADLYGSIAQPRVSGVAGIQIPWHDRSLTLLLRSVRGPSLMGQFHDKRERFWGVEASIR